MVVFNGIVAQSKVTPTPLPAQKTLDLLTSFGVVYPGNAVSAPTLELITLTEISPSTISSDIITKFLKDIYPKLQPNNYTSVAFSFPANATVGNDIQSSIYNFYSISSNDCSDIVPAGTAAPLNSAITELERTFNQYALMFIFDLFYKHTHDVSDNPHHVDSTNLADVWIDFFQILYNKYVTLVDNPLTLDVFIASKTTSYQLATMDDYLDSNEVGFVISFEIIMAMIATHDALTDNSVHPTLQETLSAETTLPSPSYYFNPGLFLLRYPESSDTTTYYYESFSLNSSLSRLTGSIFLNASIDITSDTLINILTLSFSSTTDYLTIEKLADSQTGYQINCSIDGTVYQNTLNTTSTNLLFILNYTTTGITIIYVDENSNQQTITQEIANLAFDFNTIQIGIPVAYPNTTQSNTFQELAFYTTNLSDDQISLLINSMIN